MPSTRGTLFSIAAFALLGTIPPSAMAQEGFSPRGVSPLMPIPSGGTTYLPAGPIGGGFIPYTPGPSGGLGIAGRPRASSPSAMGTSGMSAMSSRATPTLSPRGRAALSPLAPLGRLGIGIGARGGMRGPAMSTPSMSRKVRPPVGFYPFQLPTAPGGASGASAPAMSM